MKKDKKIKIAHLYYDLMNLFGEIGNIYALKKFIERQNVECEIVNLSKGDKINFKSFDVFYIGAGCSENFKIVLDDLKPRKEEISKAIESGKMFIITGNAMELFGKKVRLLDGKSIECLDLFSYQAYEAKERIVGDAYYQFDKLQDDKGKQMLGFLNRKCEIVHTENRMFGFADNMNYKNFYTFDVIGPVLIRSPYFTNYLIKKLFKDKGYRYKEITNTIEFKAYHEYIKRFIQDKNEE